MYLFYTIPKRDWLTHLRRTIKMAGTQGARINTDCDYISVPWPARLAVARLARRSLGRSLFAD